MDSPGARPMRTWDRVLTIVLLVVAVLGGLVLSVSGRFIALLGDPCGGAVRCDTGRLTAGLLIGSIGPGVAVLAALVVAVLLLVRRRVAFWVPVAGLALAFALLTAGAGLAGTGVPHH